MFNLKLQDSTHSYFRRAGVIPIDSLNDYRLDKIFKNTVDFHFQSFLCNLAELRLRETNYSIRTAQVYWVPTPNREYSRQKMSYILPKFLNSENSNM